MRIALVVHKFPPSSMGGTEVYTWNIARELAHRGHDVFVFYRHESPGAEAVAWEEREGFKACRVSRGLDAATASAPALFLDTFYNVDVERAFRTFLDAAQPDLVHFQHVMWLSYPLIAIARDRGLRTVLTLHDYWFLCGNAQLIWPDAQVCRGKAWGWNCARCALARVNAPLVRLLKPGIALGFLVRDALVRRAARQADRWLAPSHWLIEQYVKAGFPAARFTYLENGIDVERIRRHPRQASPDQQVRFSYLGSLAWQKGVHVAAQAFRGIPAQKARLRIYGSPKAFPDYSASLRETIDATNTSLEGEVPNEEVSRVLAETDMLLVPSLWYENSPMVIQEARAAGVPVIASRLGALAEKIRPGIDGLLCTPGDAQEWQRAVLGIIAEPERLKDLQSHLAPPMSIHQHVDLLERIYHA